MGKTVALVLVLVFLTASCIAVKPAMSSSDTVENSWVSKASMQEARSGLGVAVVNGKIYAIGGLDSSYKLVDTNEMYDPDTNTWTTLKSMPTPRARFGIAVCQDKIYVIGGEIGSRPSAGGLALAVSVVTGINEVYDPATDTWEAKTPMPTARVVLKANVVDGKIYCIGGAHDSHFSTVTEVYDPVNDSWVTMKPMPNLQEEFASTVVDDKIFIISDKVQIFNPKSNQWTLGTPPPTPMYQGAAGTTTGSMAPKRIYFIGGGSANQIYNPNNDSWSTGASMLTPRNSLAVAVLDDTVYAIGGWHIDSGHLAINERYTPFGYGTIPPVVDLFSLENQTYNVTSVSLDFTVNKEVSWMGYCLDGQDNVTVTGNTTLLELSNGLHSITVYAKDEFENIGFSETINFTIAVPEPEPEPFPVVPVSASVAIAVAFAGTVLLVYFRKHPMKFGDET